VIVDARLLKLFLQGEDLPFSENVSYIFEKQIEESGLLLINKIDLLAEIDAAQLLEQARERFLGKIVIAQNSLAMEGIHDWLALIEDVDTVPQHTLELDYDRYGAGEADLAWLDQRLHFSGVGSRGREFLIALIGGVEHEIRQRDFPIGHLKIEVTAGGVNAKVSFVAVETAGWEAAIPEFPAGKTVTVLLNGRVQCPAQTLKELVEAVVMDVCPKFGVFLIEDGLDAFNPGYPNPTHRIAGGK
jgi:hypothetical protein